jgi:crotonobetainyl-CoA hydratase/dehydration protein DpgD
MGHGPRDLTRVSYVKQGRVAYVTLNRPEVLNAMDQAMHVELSRVWDDIEADDDIWLAVVSGAGDRAFSVGQDLKELAAVQASGDADQSSFGSAGKPGAPRMTDRFDRIKPLIAQVRGYAFGGGFELVLGCDLIVAAEDAVFALPEAQLGLIAGAGGVFRLSRQVAPRIALEHLLTGRRMTADRALSLGLVNAVVPVDQLSVHTQDLVDDVLRCAPLAVRAARQAAWQSLELPLPVAFCATYAQEERRRSSLDAREGVQAFVDKRTPRWQGR